MTRGPWLLLAAVILVSCGEAPPVPVDRFYRLTQSPALEKKRLTEDTIYVANFVAEGLYNDRAVLYSSGERAHELQQHHYHFWYTAPPRLLRDYLVQFMRNADVSPMIMDDGGRRGRLRIAGKVVEFERRTDASGNSVNVALELNVANPGEDTPLLLRHYRANEPVAGRDMAAVIKGFNTAVDRIYTEFLGDLGTVLHAP